MLERHLTQEGDKAKRAKKRPSKKSPTRKKDDAALHHLQQSIASMGSVPSLRHMK